VVDWSGGTAVPFTAFDSSAITLDVHNTGMGPRHLIQIGSQIIDLAGLSSDPMITPNARAQPRCFRLVMQPLSPSRALMAMMPSSHIAIGAERRHQATGMTAVGQYTAATSAFSATSITLFLNN